MIEIHPEAVARFDERAKSLLLRLHVDVKPPLPTGFSPDCIKANISPVQIEDVEMSSVTPADETTSIWFSFEGKRIGLFGSDYEEFARLCEEIQRAKSIRHILSMAKIESVIFEWIKKSYRREIADTLIAFAFPKWEECVTENEIWIPLYGFFIESAFRLGKVVFRPLREEFFNRLPKMGSSEDANAAKVMQAVRVDLQGHSASTIVVVAERDRAYEIAAEETERSLGMLRLFSAAMLEPGAIGTTPLVGVMRCPVIGHFVLRDNLIVSWKEETADYARHSWGLDNRMIKQMSSDGLGFLHGLLLKAQPTPFERDLLDSISLYTRAASTTNISDRLMHVFSALEFFLLRNESEPLQQNVADRIAYWIGNTIDERKEIVKNYKSAYGLRSKYVHHGQSIDDAKQIRTCFFNVWAFYIHTIHNHGRFENRTEFFDYLDKLKYS